MSREDDFDDIMDSPDSTEIGQDDTSEPLLEDESFDEAPVAEAEPEPQQVSLFESEVVVVREVPLPRKPAAKKKKAVAKAKAKKKTVAKKAAKPARKPAAKKTTAKKKAKEPAKKTVAKKPAKKTAKKTAKKKTRPVAKKKKATKKK